MRTYLVPVRRGLICVIVVSFLYCLNMSSLAGNRNRVVISEKVELDPAAIAAPLLTQSLFTGHVKGNNVGLVNATVSLLDANNTVVAMGTTDANGLYQIFITTPTCTNPPPVYRTIASTPTWTMNKDGGSQIGCPGVFPPDSVVFADIVMIRVVAVQWEEVYTAQLAVNPADLGGGDRMFPDKHTPSDNPTTSRRVIKIVAGITQPQAVANIYVKVFDVDDPTTSLEIDPNGILGTDNRGIDSSPMQTTIQVTGGNPSGIVLFTTSMYAGDNFVVAASTDLNYLNGITVDGTALKDAAGSPIPVEPETPSTAKRSKMLTVWRRLHIEEDSMGIVTNNFAPGTLISARVTSVNVTELTTSLSFSEVNQFEYGRINIFGLGTYEVLGSGTGPSLVYILGTLNTEQVAGKSFTLSDDDDFDSNGMFDADNGTDVEPIKGTFVLMQESDDAAKNVFAAAYIMPIRDGAGNSGNSNNQTNIVFNLNIELGNFMEYDEQIAAGKNSTGADANDYWVAYIQVGYQGPIVNDADPDNSGGIIADLKISGITVGSNVTDSVTGNAQNPPVMPLGGDDTIICIEVVREIKRDIGVPVSIVAPHEIGHQFGLRGDTRPSQPGGSDDYGIMSVDSTFEFVPTHINVLRWRKLSPGH